MIADEIKVSSLTVAPSLGKEAAEPQSSPDNLRWRNAAQWARNSMVNDGLMKNDSPRGVWEISDKGRNFLAGEID